MALVVEQLWQPVPGGSGTYVRELTRALLERPDVAPVGVTARHRGPAEPSWAPAAGLPLVTSALPRPALYEAWTRARRPRTWRRAGAGAVDLVHATTWAVPPRGPGLVVTVHDLAFERSPEHFTPRGVAFFRRALDVVRAEADAVIAVSATTRDDCVAAGIDPSLVHVVHHGVSVPPVSQAAVAEVRARVGGRPYVLWAGTLEPRKNVAGLVRAFARLVDDHDLDLVLVGPSGWGEEHEATRRAVEALPAGRVHVLGRLTTEALHAAYRGARAVCFPSFWEGFGMPVLEAMAHGVPVVTSAGTSMAEVGGPGGAVLVDPRDDAAIAAGIEHAVGPEHDALAARAAAHAATFTWRRCAEETVAVYRGALAPRG